MIVEYNRPDTIDTALLLLERKEPRTMVLGGGNFVTKYDQEDIAVVDLQKLGLNQINLLNNEWLVGSTATLQQMLTSFSDFHDLCEAIKIDATRNIRQTATIGGYVHCADGRAALLTCLLALDCQITWLPGDIAIKLGDWLPQRGKWNQCKLIKQISWTRDVLLKFESVGRTPYDKPIICCAVAKWPSGRIRIAVGGFGKIPSIVLDGDQKDDLDLAIKNVCQNAEDQWGSAKYRQEACTRLGKRLLSEINREGDK